MCPNWCSSENTGLKFIKQRLTSKLECMHTRAHMTYTQSCRVFLWLVCVYLWVALSGCTIYWLVSCLLRIVPGSLSAICLPEAHVIRMLNLYMLKYTQIHTYSCYVNPYKIHTQRTDVYSYIYMYWMSQIFAKCSNSCIHRSSKVREERRWLRVNLLIFLISFSWFAFVSFVIFMPITFSPLTCSFRNLYRHLTLLVLN